MIRIAFTPLAVVSAVLFTAPAWGDEVSCHSDFADLIKSLDARRFAEREAATRILLLAGQRAIPSLALAGRGDSREASLRSLRILGKHYQKGGPELKSTVKAALEEIAAGDNRMAAGRAKEILKTTTDRSQFVWNPRQLILGGGGQVQLQALAFGGAVRRRMSVKVNNGVRQTEVIEKDRTVKIHEDAKQRITLEISETRNGKTETKKYDAKDEEDLKLNHPEAHKMYQKYSQQGSMPGIERLPLPLHDG